MKQCDIFGIKLGDIYGDSQIGPDALDVYLKNNYVRTNLITLTSGRYDKEHLCPTISYKKTTYGDEEGQFTANFIVLVNSIDSKGLEGAGHYYCIHGDKLNLFVDADEIVKWIEMDCNYIRKQSM
jgi:hypothetical protein